MLDNSAVWGSTSGNVTMPHVFSRPRKSGNVLEKVSRRQPVVAEVTARISVEFYDTQSPANLAAAGGWGGDGQCQMVFFRRHDVILADVTPTPLHLSFWSHLSTVCSQNIHLRK